jgi:hypothetical protein
MLPTKLNWKLQQKQLKLFWKSCLVKAAKLQ